MLTKKQKKILNEELRVNPNYKASVRFKARRKAEKALELLIFLAAVYPEAINLENLTEIVASIMKHGRITQCDRHVIWLPPSFGVRKTAKGGFVKVGGVLRNKVGGFLKKPEIYRNVRLSYDLLKIMHQQLANEKLCPFNHVNQVVQLEQSAEGQYKLKVSTLEFWLKNIEKLGNAKIFVITESLEAQPHCKD